ncbi:MAG: hypothetical protein QJR05_04520 [Thermoanaerobacterium sp.]|nr:hypothetical protein [Thermoanaerobacterium sp.]
MSEKLDLSLCTTCRFMTKCDRYDFFEMNTSLIEREAFKRWGVDLITLFSVEECDRYKPDPLIEDGVLDE